MDQHTSFPDRGPQWLESVYSDGTADFVSNPAPALGETVRIRVRFYADAPVKAVILRTNPNGADVMLPAKPVKTDRGLVWWEAELKMSERRMQYQFYLVTDGGVYFYTQKGITTWLPDMSCDFVLLTDYVQPAWVKEAVFYQIFPERFRNGDPENDVRSGEYSVDGNPTIRVTPWDTPAMEYAEGHCLDFYGGDLEGIRQKIPYLKDLGVTALYLNPIFVGPSVHKYDCVDYFHVDPHFGGDEALAALSRDLHACGMKLILDISINHTGASHKWFNRDCQWFPKEVGAYHNPDSTERGFYFFGPDNSYKSWWGISSLPVLNFTSEALRDRIWRARDSVLRKWLQPPYSIDGWRFDVADVFARNDEIQLAHEVWPEIRRAIREENPQAYILAEDWGDCAQYLQGSEWDSPMNYYGCGRVIREFLGEQDHFLARCPEIRDVRRKMRAEEVRARVVQHLSRMPWALQENQFNLFDSHDIGRLHNNQAIDPGEYRGAVIFQFMLPGAASVYYGDEASIGGDPGSNEGCRWPMPWGTEFEKTERFRFYRTLMRLKADHPALSSGGMQFLFAEGGVLSIARFTDCGAAVPGADVPNVGAVIGRPPEAQPIPSDVARAICPPEATGSGQQAAGDGGHAAREFCLPAQPEAFVFVMSTEDSAREIRLPLGALGCSRPVSDRDVFGTPLSWRPLDEKSVSLAVPAHTALLFPANP